MKNIKITVEKLIEIVNNNSNIGMGSYGLIKEINDNYLFKFNYKDFISCFKQEGNKITLVLESAEKVSREIEIRKGIDKFMCEDGVPNRIKNLQALIKKQDKVKNTTFTQGFVYVDDYCVGYLLKHHKNMVNLFKYVKENNVTESEQKVILSQIKSNMCELLDNAIYLKDFTMRNMLYNPKTQQVQFIDFEDAMQCNESKDEFMESRMLEQYEKIAKSFEKDNEKSL